MINILCLGKINTDYFHIYENDIVKHIDDYNVIVFLDVKVGNIESLERFLKFVKESTKKDKDVAIITSDYVLKYGHAHTFTSSDIRDINDKKDLFYFGFNADSSDILSLINKKKKRAITLDAIDIIFSKDSYDINFNGKFLYANGKRDDENSVYVKPLMSLTPKLTSINIDNKVIDIKTSNLKKINVDKFKRSEWEFKV